MLLSVLEGIRRAEPEWKLHLILGENGPLAGGAESLGAKPEVVPFPPALSALGDAQADGSKLAKVLAAWPAAFLYGKRLRSAVRSLKANLIHSNGFKMHVLGTWAKPRRTPLIWHLHDFVTSRPVMKHLLSLHASRCTGAVAVSESVKADVENACGGRLPVRCIWNAVDLQRFHPEGPQLDLDALSDLPPAACGTLRIGLVATFARWKGHETFLRALSRLASEPPVRGYVVGGPIYQTGGSQYSIAELQAFAAAAGLTGRVGFTGFVPDTAAAMRSLDIVVHGSTRPEPFGLVIAEAMASGRPVIVANAGGAAEIIVENEDALAHRPGDAEELAARMEHLVRNVDRRCALGRRARVSAEKRFDRNRLTAEMIGVYRWALQEGR